jgi:plasmid maintenance system killer protein
MLIGYAGEKIRKVCQDSRASRKHLPENVAKALHLRLTQLAAFARLSDVPTGTPTHRHWLTENWAGHLAVRVDKKYRIIFKPAGDFESLPDGTPDTKTVTSIEIVAVEDYHWSQ